MSPPAQSPLTNRLVLIDSKEIGNHDIWLDDSPNAQFLPGTFLHEGMRYEKRALTYGDFQIELKEGAYSLQPWLVVESKTWGDLRSSLNEGATDRDDTRLRHQVHGLLGLKSQGFQVAVMVVGIMTPAGGKKSGVYIQNKGHRTHRSWDWFALNNILLALQHLGIMTFVSPTEHQVPRTLSLAAALLERPEHFAPEGLAPFAYLTPRLGQLARTFTAVEGVGRTLAMTLATSFGSFPDFYAASSAGLQDIEGIGPVMADRIYDHFHDPLKEAVQKILSKGDPR